MVEGADIAPIRLDLDKVASALDDAAQMLMAMLVYFD